MFDCRSIRLSYARRNARADSNRQPTVPITHNLRPAEKCRRIKNELGVKRALPLSYPSVWSRRPDSNRRPRALQAITQSCDPSKGLFEWFGKDMLMELISAGFEPAASRQAGRSTG
jgi:hypothetical protein